eukprot:TRINITY_DN4641_c0_g1_i2.p1 TRINITY_DN4641_c0_g1~~TRINITY_DN4641_c0_g1_i2.p1  ORF type:complete len:904 (-),score=310.77 TRINITY_DN4641_c0_g1_i2:228-2939(-)
MRAATMLGRLLGLVTLASMAAPSSAQMSAVLGIDLGTQFFKVAYVKTGQFDLVLNEASKRKTATAVAFNEGERYVGDTAQALKLRYPSKVVTKFQRLLGRQHADTTLKSQGFGEYDLPFKLEQHPTRGTVVIDLESGNKFQPEEVMAYVLSYIRDISEAHLEQKVIECVITVPPFMTEHERRLMHDAAAIADLKVLTLLNDNTAAALRYGIEPPAVPDNTHVLFVDLGASHLTNTLVRYFTNNITAYDQVLSMEVKAVTYDNTVGGSSFDRRLAMHLAKQFNEQHNKKIEENPRAMIKLTKEAEKVKQVLSANGEFMVAVESLMDDIDFKYKITRAEFEDICKDLFERLDKPIKDVIVMSGLEPSQISQVIPFGAATRMPQLKTQVLKATQKDDWTPRINTDEAAALGAAFVAANFSKSFKLRAFHVYDNFPFSVGVSVGGKEATLFKAQSVFDSKKTLTQTIDEAVTEANELKLSLQYDDKSVLPVAADFNDFPMDLAEYSVTGMNEALAKHNVTGAPKVALAIGLGKDGIADLIHADAKVHSMDLIKKQRFIKKNVTVEEFVADNTTNATNDTEESATNDNTSTADSATTENDSTDNDTNETQKKKTPKGSLQNVTRERTVEVWEENLEKVLHLEPLNVSRVHKGIPPMSAEEFKEAVARHKALVAEEKGRREKVDAKNDLEGWIFGSRQKLSEDGMETVSTEEERAEISALLEAGEDWLWDEGDDAETSVYKSKKGNMSAVVKGVFLRFEELEKRASSISMFESIVTDTRLRIVNWTSREAKRISANESTWIHKNETDRLSKMVDDAETWLAEKVTELETVGLLVTPPFTAREVGQQIRPVVSEVEYLRYRPKPLPKYKPKRPKKANNSNSSNASANASTAETNSEEKPTEEKTATKDDL